MQMRRRLSARGVNIEIREKMDYLNRYLDMWILMYEHLWNLSERAECEQGRSCSTVQESGGCEATTHKKGPKAEHICIF